MSKVLKHLLCVECGKNMSGSPDKYSKEYCSLICYDKNLDRNYELDITHEDCLINHEVNKSKYAFYYQDKLLTRKRSEELAIELRKNKKDQDRKYVEFCGKLRPII